MNLKAALLFLVVFGLFITTVFAADATIDSTTNTTTAVHKLKPKVVFISSTTGYMFYRDSGGTCAYSKTTDGGANWGSAVNTTAQTDCVLNTVWYDQWTPGSSGTVVHIVFADTGSDDMWYDTFDTNGDSNGSEVAMNTTAGNTFSQVDNLAITRGTDGDLYIGFCDGAAAAACNVKKCTGTCTSAGNWVQAGASTPIDVANDYLQMMPLASGDILLIRDDISANDIQSKVYDDGTNGWDGSWAPIDSSAVENTTYSETVTATVNRNTNDIYLAYGASVAGAGTADIRTAIYNGSWSNTADVATDQNTLIANDIAIDELSGDVYAAYTKGVAGSLTDIYYKKSIDGMSSWGSETKLNSALTSDFRYVYLNMMSSSRVFGGFHQNTATTDGMFGATITTLSALDHTWSTGAADFKIYESGSLTWGAGTLACEGTLTDDNSSTISCANGTNIKDSTQYRVDILLKNNGGTTAKMNGSSDFVDHVAVKSGWAGTSPTLGSCGFYDASSDNGSTSCTAAWNSTNNVRITNTGAANVNIQAAGTEGFMYLITTGSDVPSSNSISYMNTTIDSVSEDSSKVTISKQVSVSISASDGVITYGSTALSSSRDTTSGGLNDTQTITNDGGVTVTLNIKGQDSACPWALAGSIGSDQYKHEFCKTGSGSPDPCDSSPTWTALTTTYQTLATGIAASGTQKFDLQLSTPSSTSCYTQQSVDVTVQAVEE